MIFMVTRDPQNGTKMYPKMMPVAPPGDHVDANLKKSEFAVSRGVFEKKFEKKSNLGTLGSPPMCRKHSKNNAFLPIFDFLGANCPELGPHFGDPFCSKNRSK